MKALVLFILLQYCFAVVAGFVLYLSIQGSIGTTEDPNITGVISAGLIAIGGTFASVYAGWSELDKSRL